MAGVALSPVVRLNTSFPTGNGRRVTDLVVRNDIIDGGAFSIAGNVYLNGPPQTPASRRVRLHDRVSGRPMRETWSNAVTGAYAFEAIKPGLYYVVAFDHTENYNAVIKDRIMAV